jgi:transposase
MSKNVLGIDVSKKDLSVALLINEKFHEKTVENSSQGFQSLMRFIKSKTSENVTVYLEATGVYSEDISDFFFENSFDVKVVNPIKIHAFGKAKLSRNKTDKADAKLIAEYGKTFPEERSYTPKSSNQKRLRALYRTYVAFIDQTIICKTHLESSKDSEVRDLWNNNLQYLKGQIKEIMKKMIDITKQECHSKYKLLLTIPGIGVITAIAILAEIGDASDFLNARQLAAYVGVTPKHRCSGTSVRGKSRISKIGNSVLRKAIYMPAMTTSRCSPAIKEWTMKLRDRGKKGMQIIVAVMRRLIHIIYGVLKNSTEFDENMLLGTKKCV